MKSELVKQLEKLEQVPAKKYKEPKVAVSQGALAMVINALRRDAAEGKAVRGEMADLIELSME